MAAIAIRLHHPPPALRRGRPPSNPFLRLDSSPTILLRSHAAVIPPLAPVAARRNEGDDDAPHNPEHRRSPLGLSTLLVATATVAASPQVALALSGGSCGGYDDSSSSSSSSSSSCDDSTTDFAYWSSDDSTPEPEKKKGKEATHESVGTGAAPPVPPSDAWICGGILALVLAMVVAANIRWVPDETTSVVKLQVALRGTEIVKSAQKDLNAMAERVQGPNKRWYYKFILAETMCTLRRNQYFCISSSSSVVVRAGEGAWKGTFDAISTEERRKFDEETLSNWNGVKQKKTYSMKTDGSKNEYIVITILIAANGRMNLPKTIRSAAELDTLAVCLNSTPASELRGIRVLWTPQDPDDVLSEERMRKDYPNLEPLA